MTVLRGNNGAKEAKENIRKTAKSSWKSDIAEFKFSDDGTTSFFWRAHTLTVLFILIGGLIYVALFEPDRDETTYNIKRGIVACVVVFILLGVTVTPDGVFKRPHPVVWRFTFCCSIVYELGLIFILFQTKKDAIGFLKHIDPKLGDPLEEKSYGGNCRIYDHDVPNDPFHNVWMLKISSVSTDMFFRELVFVSCCMIALVAFRTKNNPVHMSAAQRKTGLKTL